jgi:hypothetical protein
MGLQADLKADVGVQAKAERSQTFVLVMSVLSGASLLGGMYFLNNKPGLSWIPFLFCLVFLGVACAAWFRSHKNSDLESATPASVKHGVDGSIEVQTDARTLFSPEALKGFGELVSMIALRRPLPPPSGKLNDDGSVIEDSQESAVQEVLKINAQAEQSARELLGPAVNTDYSRYVQQPRIDVDAQRGNN